MAALTRPTEANYEVHENVRVDTQDNEDHTFCGIMFPIKAKQDVPVSQVVLHAVAVRGQLGPLTVWVSHPNLQPTTTTAATNNSNNNNNRNAKEYRFSLQARQWQKIYQGTHAPSMREYQWLDFSHNPVVLQPGQVRALYIHSTLQGDEAIVYDNAHVRPHWHYAGAPRRPPQAVAPRYSDAYINILTGKAHLSPRPFGQTPIWGWGNAWRDHREFVGQIKYGVRFQLWQPHLTSTVYGPHFRRSVQTLLACQRRLESPVARLPDECLYYILNMCKWDWWQDDTTTLKEQRRRVRRGAQRQASSAQATAITTSTASENPVTGGVVRQVTNESSTAVAAEPMEESSERVDDDDNHEDANMEQQPDDDDDDDDDDEYDDIEEEEDSDSDESAWERQHGYRADTQVFIYRDVSSDDESEEEDEDPQAAAAERQAWFRRHFARIHILRALAQAEDAGNDDDTEEAMQVGQEDDSSDDDEDYEDNYESLQDTDEEG